MRTLAAALSLALAAPAAAQCTSTPNHFCVSYAGLYVVNGVTRPQITLTRGQTYEFQMINIPGNHPFYFALTCCGAGQPAWTEGLSPDTFAYANQTLTFAVPMNAPDTLWYECMFHSGLGNRVNIIDPPCDADYNADGFVDFLDFSAFVDCFDTANCPSGKSADFNRDGFTDFFDFADFITAFEQGC